MNEPASGAPPAFRTARARLGAAVRWVTQFTLVRIVLAVLAIGAGANVVRLGFEGAYRALDLGPVRQSTLWYAIPLVIALHLSYVAYVRLVERRRVDELSPRGAGRELAIGVGVGAALFTGTIALIAAAGAFQVTEVRGWAFMLPALAMALGAAYGEELFFRGIIFRLTESSLGTWAALAISSLLFGAAHMANPHATPLGAAAIMLEAGVLLGAAYVLTRRLWLAIGIHFAWNFTQGGIFGVNVSGHQMGGLLGSTLTGPAWLSGGALGAEGSVFAVALCGIVATYFLVRAHRKGHFIRPFWRRSDRRSATRPLRTADGLPQAAEARS